MLYTIIRRCVQYIGEIQLKSPLSHPKTKPCLTKKITFLLQSINSWGRGFKIKVVSSVGSNGHRDFQIRGYCSNAPWTLCPLEDWIPGPLLQWLSCPPEVPYCKLNSVRRNKKVWISILKHQLVRRCVRVARGVLGLLFSTQTK